MSNQIIKNITKQLVLRTLYNIKMISVEIMIPKKFFLHKISVLIHLQVHILKRLCSKIDTKRLKSKNCSSEKYYFQYKMWFLIINNTIIYKIYQKPSLYAYYVQYVVLHLVYTVNVIYRTNVKRTLAMSHFFSLYVYQFK